MNLSEQTKSDPETRAIEPDVLPPENKRFASLEESIKARHEELGIPYNEIEVFFQTQKIINVVPEISAEADTTALPAMALDTTEISSDADTPAASVMALETHEILLSALEEQAGQQDEDLSTAASVMALETHEILLSTLEEQAGQQDEDLSTEGIIDLMRASF